MTEITAKKKNRDIYVIDPVAFFAALFGAPILVALIGCWMAGIPVFALILGGPIYLAIGTPVLLWHLSRNAPNSWTIAGLALASCAVPASLLLGYGLATGDQSFATGLMFFGGFGLIFAPLWGGVFGILYRQFRREIYVNPI